MITKDDVICVFKGWRSAGLRPPVDNGNVDQAEALIDSFQRNYNYLDADQLKRVGERLAHHRYWPTYFDVDEVAREIQRQDEPKGYQGDLMKEVRRKGPRLTESIDEMAQKTADRIWPDMDEATKARFVAENKMELFQKGWFDRVCACCDGMYCKSGGHRACLRIVPDAVIPTVYFELEAGTCEKYMPTRRDR